MHFPGIVMKRFDYLILGLVFTVLSFRCTREKALPSGFDTLQRNYTGEIKVVELKATRAGRYWATPVTGLRANLLLGMHNDVSSFLLLRFLNFTEIDTATVTSATVKMYQKNVHGSGNPFTVTVYPVTTDWDEVLVRWNDIQSAYDRAAPLGNFQLEALDSTVVQFELPPNVVNEWVTKNDNYGILLAFDSADFMAEFYAWEIQTNLIEMDLIYDSKAGGLDTVEVTVENDASLLYYEPQVDEKVLVDNIDRLWVDNGTGYASYIMFDISAIPLETTIHHALLKLPVDQSQSETGDDGMTLTAAPVVEDSTWNPQTTKIDSLYQHPQTLAGDFSDEALFSSNTAVDNMTFYVQLWSTKRSPNYGIILQSAEYGNNVDKMSFYFESGENALRPTLRVTYSIPASTRF